MNSIWKWLCGFFILGVADPQADPPLDDLPADEADTEEDAPLDEEAPDEEPATDEDTVAAAATQAAQELKEAKEERDRLKAELEAARRQPASAPGVTDEQRLHEQEEAKLRDGKTTELERWQINSNRTLRESKRSSAAALIQAQDLSDRTGFNQLAITNPAIHKRYAERVEAELTKMRGGGQNAPREAILRFLIGDDAIKGVLKSKKPAGKVEAQIVDRGKSPGARSDVAAKGRLTEAQKREKRLDGVQL